jgi:hypothetical protein
VDYLANLLNVLFKEPKRVGIREHEPGDVAVCADFAQVIEIG